MMNNYHDEPAVLAEAIAIAEDMGVDQEIIRNMINQFGPSTVIRELTAVQKEIENGHL